MECATRPNGQRLMLCLRSGNMWNRMVLKVQSSSLISPSNLLEMPILSHPQPLNLLSQQLEEGAWESGFLITSGDSEASWSVRATIPDYPIGRMDWRRKWLFTEFWSFVDGHSRHIIDWTYPSLSLSHSDETLVWEHQWIVKLSKPVLTLAKNPTSTRRGIMRYVSNPRFVISVG